MAYAEKRTYDKLARKWRWRGKYKLLNGKWASVSRDDNDAPFYTERSAREYAAGLEADLRRGRTVIGSTQARTTVHSWSAMWIESIDLAPLSMKEYRLRLKNHILPEWGGLAVKDLSPVGIAAWEKRLRLRLSPNYVEGILTTFRSMMHDAVKEGLRLDNPVPSKQGGRRGRYTPQVKEEKATATPRQALLIARNALAMRGLNEYALVLTSAYTGMRIGEIAGLHRDQVELVDTGRGFRLHSSQQSQYVNGALTEIDNKYASSRGLIIPPFLAELLTELIASRPESEWVFTAPKGGRLLRGGDWYTNTWQPLVAGRAPRGVVRGAKARVGIRPVLGVEGLTPHGLRHSQKVWLDEGGHPRVAVEARMGHVLQGVEGVYSHVTLKMELAVAASLQALWEESLRTVVDRREFGPYPPLKKPRQKRSPKNLPGPSAAPSGGVPPTS
ncbi:tyrosine-type recombinase/integrase [Streptomyces sp. NPDC012888]|uniref:tyrosine-type recombinase/integrase n=1 Tax=Streptomyces sp. NPDC012888 TaxID=3364855 RepID=UPI0036CE0EFF